MILFRKIADWSKYERLHHYPSLRAFDRDAALKRLLAYEREEREASRTWFRVSFGLVTVFLAVYWLLLRSHPAVFNALLIVTILPGWILQYAMHRRIRRRVQAKVKEELADGRLWTCIECGYDLRASESRCPECGAAVRVEPP